MTLVQSWYQYDIHVYDVRACEGNSRNYWQVNSSQMWTVFRISGNSKKCWITYIYKVLGCNLNSFAIYDANSDSSAVAKYIKILM